MKCLFIDVDGTLTDGKIYMGPNGEVCKAFDIKDGCGIHDILPRYGIVPVIITGRRSEIVANRAWELKITELYQGVRDKCECLNKVLEKFNCPADQAAYIGDDLLDLPAMRLCGLKGCPADAVLEVREICDHVCKAPGGCGAVREFIEWIIQKNREE